LHRHTTEYMVDRRTKSAIMSDCLRHLGTMQDLEGVFQSMFGSPDDECPIYAKLVRDAAAAELVRDTARVCRVIRTEKRKEPMKRLRQMMEEARQEQVNLAVNRLRGIVLDKIQLPDVSPLSMLATTALDETAARRQSLKLRLMGIGTSAEAYMPSKKQKR
jgi:hypothetical protein